MCPSYCVYLWPCAADASPADIAAQAAEDAAWTELQRCSAWWLGEFVNSAAGETAGLRQPQTPGDEHNAEDTAGLSAAETLALKASPRGTLHLYHTAMAPPLHEPGRNLSQREAPTT